MLDEELVHVVPSPPSILAACTAYSDLVVAGKVVDEEFRTTFLHRQRIRLAVSDTDDDVMLRTEPRSVNPRHDQFAKVQGQVLVNTPSPVDLVVVDLGTETDEVDGIEELGLDDRIVHDMVATIAVGLVIERVDVVRSCETTIDDAVTVDLCDDRLADFRSERIVDAVRGYDEDVAFLILDYFDSVHVSRPFVLGSHSKACVVLGGSSLRSASL